MFTIFSQQILSGYYWFNFFFFLRDILKLFSFLNYRLTTDITCCKTIVEVIYIIILRTTDITCCKTIVEVIYIIILRTKFGYKLSCSLGYKLSCNSY